ncbi:hypothetical protein [Myxococcus xanthus]|uniref:Uncharacterized protein n=1 Tax=Myxococcus xanthus TaxID=34 RepID=A0AAE6KSL8_MYXXA|nr:hypothetical protein [Myxococcus xanthus]QDE68320.1 hypothetical protein BHS09_15780 [Myxococcus xanthus]QDE75597.1 hypothetical protein BHS08_15795 [Myxococcus xanthus]QDE82924.1 hypothetical protein BHS07_15955 [Myxococcus xanthus]QDE97169.1 hypothetical protein BHS05_15690 [Myxococcus xanthus]
MKLHRYWIGFSDRQLAHHEGLGYGVGVTAFSLDDAVRMLGQQVFKESPVPSIERIIEDVDVSSLDPNHVLPNIAPPVFYGVWYPSAFMKWDR